MKRLIPLLAVSPLFAAVLIIAPARSTAGDPPPFDPTAEPASLAQSFLKTKDLDALKGLKRVAIPSFRVEFVIENSGHAHSSGTGGWTSTNSKITLAGVDDATRQAIADGLYDRLVADLQAAGMEVVPYETLRDNEQYKSMSARFKPSPDVVGMQEGKSAFVAPHGMPVYYDNDDRRFGVMATFGNMSTVQPQNIEPKIAKELDAAVLRVRYVVGFAEMKKSGGLFRSGSSVEQKPHLFLMKDETRYALLTPGGDTARITLDDTVLAGDNVLQSREITTTAEKATQAAMNVVTGILAHGGTVSREYEAVATPEAYTGAVNQYAGALQSAFVSLVKGAL